VCGGCQRARRARRHLRSIRAAPRTGAVISTAWGARGRQGTAYVRPVGVVCGDFLGLRQAEDALLEGEFGVGRAHRYACQGYVRIVRVVVRDRNGSLLGWRLSRHRKRRLLSHAFATEWRRVRWPCATPPSFIANSLFFVHLDAGHCSLHSLVFHSKAREELEAVHG
jgi:hypothetical protein